MSTEIHPAVSDAMREAVAREIDPDAVSYGDTDYQGGNYTKIAFSNRKRAVLKMADAILSGPIASEIARLTGERDAAREETHDLKLRAALTERPVYSRRQLTARAEAAKAETARLRAALEFYADEAAWSGHPWRLTFESPGRDGHGPDVARAALSSQEKADA
jgi:hypothetical protein